VQHYTSNAALQQLSLRWQKHSRFARFLPLTAAHGRSPSLAGQLFPCGWHGYSANITDCDNRGS
jgi:hypothetical protein